MNFLTQSSSTGISVKNIVDWTAVAAAWGTFANIIPPLVGLVSLVWLGIQIFTWVINKGWRKKLDE